VEAHELRYTRRANHSLPFKAAPPVPAEPSSQNAADWQFQRVLFSVSFFHAPIRGPRDHVEFGIHAPRPFCARASNKVTVLRIRSTRMPSNSINAPSAHIHLPKFFFRMSSVFHVGFEAAVNLFRDPAASQVSRTADEVFRAPRKEIFSAERSTCLRNYRQSAAVFMPVLQSFVVRSTHHRLFFRWPAERDRQSGIVRALLTPVMERPTGACTLDVAEMFEVETTNQKKTGSFAARISGRPPVTLADACSPGLLVWANLVSTRTHLRKARDKIAFSQSPSPPKTVPRVFDFSVCEETDFHVSLSEFFDAFRAYESSPHLLLTAVPFPLSRLLCGEGASGLNMLKFWPTPRRVAEERVLKMPRALFLRGDAISTVPFGFLARDYPSISYSSAKSESLG